MSNPAGMRASRPQCRAVPAILTLIVIVLLLRVSTRRRPRTVASGELSAKIPTAKDVAEAEAEAEAGGDSEGETVAIPIPEHEFIDPTLDMEQALFEEKLALVVSVLYARGVFEVNVTRVPILLPLFQELAKARKYFVKGLDMRDYDTSCNRYFEDSASTSGAFDRGLYLEKEYLYKIRFRNRSEPFLTQPVCDRGSDRGCCLECNTEAIKDLRDRVEQARGSGDQQPSGFGPAGSELPSCCLCKFDGAKDLTSKILTPSKSSLKVMHWLQRGFQHPDEKKTKMRAEYRQVLEALGFRPRPDDEAGQLEMKRMTFVKVRSSLPPSLSLSLSLFVSLTFCAFVACESPLLQNFNYIPPGGFLMWHTNKYDNNLVPFRLYLISMDQGEHPPWLEWGPPSISPP